MYQLILPSSALQRLRDPLAIVLGSPASVADVVAMCGLRDVTCYQMDLHQAARLREELVSRGAAAKVVTFPDAWDMPARFQSVLVPSERGGERELKIDMVEQSFHVLVPGGTLVVVSEFEADRLYPNLFKKIFGRVHADTVSRPSVFWSERTKDRARRRHEQTFQARIGTGESRRFLSRPGVFSYGHMDDGARALVEVAEVRPGDRVLDLGCGCGTNGVFAGRSCAPNGHVTFVDSNVRALALAEHNARLNGLEHFDIVASATAEELPAASFDVALANPPYYAKLAIAQAFVERCRRLLRPDGRFYLVTRRIEEMNDVIGAVFSDHQILGRRGYGVFFAAVSR